MMGSSDSPDNEHPAGTHPYASLSLGLHTALAPPGLHGAAAPAYEPTSHPAALNGSPTMSVNGPQNGGSNVRRRFSGSFLPRSNGNPSPVDNMAGFDSVLHSEDPLLNPSYKLSGSMSHMHENHHFDHHQASYPGRLNTHGHHQPLLQHPHALHPHHPHLSYNLHQQNQDSIFDQHQFLRDGTPSESMHHSQLQDQHEQHQPARSQRAVSASTARPGSTHNTMQSGQLQDLPPFSAAESVLRFLATTDSGEMFSLPPPNQQQQQHHELQQQQQQHYAEDFNLGHATAARYQQQQNITESANSDDAFLKKFSVLGIRSGDDHEFYAAAGFAGTHPNNLGDHSLPEATNSVIRPFLFDAFLGTNAELGLTADDYRYGSTFDHGFPHQQHLYPQLHHQQSLGSFESHQGLSITPRHGDGFGREYDDMEYMLSPPGKPYSAVPPPGYICKLCFVEGHWLKNCNLYQARRRTPDHLPFYASSPAEYDNNQSQQLHQNHGRNQQQRVPSRGNGNILDGFHFHGGSGGERTQRCPQKTTVPPDGYVCRKCNTPGHWIQQCPMPKQSIPPDGYTCKICLVKGHWIHQCPLRTAPQSNGGGNAGNSLYRPSGMAAF
ncbi:hypothetical protein HDU86_004436 [Geranomyces michiganensis]|nr:hypothetical protein HDU86_004436 [Geranomyces michiganensis]